MKIIIVGAGLSGLSTVIALRKYLHPLDPDLDIKIYDEADTHGVHSAGWNDHADIRLKRQGAAISLQSNAVRVLRDLDPKLADRVIASGFPCEGFTWKTAGGWTLGREKLGLLPVSRPLLVRCLVDALGAKDQVAFRSVAKVVTKTGSKPVVHFDDGSTETADLVVGADGIRSPIRRCLLGDNEAYRPIFTHVEYKQALCDTTS